MAQSTKPAPQHDAPHRHTAYIAGQNHFLTSKLLSDMPVMDRQRTASFIEGYSQECFDAATSFDR